MQNAIADIRQRFVRRTSLSSSEYRINFRQLDCDVIEAITSEEASKVTPLMSKIYLRLINAPSRYWEREGVLRFTGEEMEGKWWTAWDQLTDLVGVASATARKGLEWLREQGIIGYFAGRNGVGIRIFINRAASSIGQKSDHGQKNLRIVPTSSDARRTSSDEVPFKEASASLEELDLDLIPRAPEAGAADTSITKQNLDPVPAPAKNCLPPSPPTSHNCTENHPVNITNRAAFIEQIVREIIPKVREAAVCEHERTREWFINRALPKAIRIAQASAYDVLRAHGQIDRPRLRTGKDPAIGDGRKIGKHGPIQTTPRLLSDREVNELAESCIALLATRHQAIDVSLSEMSIGAGGFLLPDDVPRVRARAEALIPAIGGN